ncbi:MAG: phosphatidate cytidylyltransferase [Flavobacteriales bacterium]|nr:phosphatidate cytidylyltransferase [Flavobacteriales bacterium]
MKELGVRAVTGAIYVALTLGAGFAGPFTTFLLFLPVCVIAAREMHLLYWGEEGAHPISWSMMIAGTVHIALAMCAFDADWHIGYALSVGFVLTLITITWHLLHGVAQPAQALAGVLLLLLLIAMPFGLLAHLFDYSPWMFIGFMVLLWTNDTGAYLVGRSIGRTKLLPAVSPKKTVEGLLGGIVLTLGAAWMIARYQDFLALPEWLSVAAIIAITSTLGDLLESAFKRARGVKDSGAILPGHGGILDRFDGFFLAIPSVLLYLHLIR